MSIVEHALDKSRTSQLARQARRSSDDAVGRTKQATAIDPSLRIRGEHIEVDGPACRERRVLLHGAEEDDRPAVAAYRMLRTRLLHRIRTKKWTTIAVTSANQSDGKTLTALNLAISMAREKSREIVLLDLDMRNPSVFRTLGIQPVTELRHYLETGEGARDVFVSVCSDNLLVAGSVVPTDQASELLASSRFDDLLSLIKQGTVNPIVLIDLPPVLLTDDALVVAAKIDSFLIVASEGLTKKDDIARAIELLSEFPIAGVALNRAVDATAGYDYGYEMTDERDAPAKGR